MSNPCEAHLVGRPQIYLSEPCSTANQITYLYFCTLGGLTNPRATKVEHHNGSHVYFTYHYLSY